ncbi:MAG: peptidase M15A [Alphaproteobacteria bacterium]|nr:peptidase M15A [Alphaproteobacteria bacterium]
MTNLSDHFTLAEAAKSQLAERKGIDNTPPAAILPRLVRVASQILEPVRSHYRVPFSPSSWYRCPVLNAAVGSKGTSQHLAGRAVDFEVPGVANVDLARWCASNLTFDQLILEFYREGNPASGWVHCSIAKEGVGRGEVLTLTKDGVRPGLPPGLNQ